VNITIPPNSEIIGIIVALVIIGTVIVWGYLTFFGKGKG